MKINELESIDNLRKEILDVWMESIVLDIKDLYSVPVRVGAEGITFLGNPCVYKETVYDEIGLLLFKHKVTKRTILVDVFWINRSLTVCIYDSVIYPVVKKTFEAFGDRHENSITQINLVKEW